MSVAAPSSVSPASAAANGTAAAPPAAHAAIALSPTRRESFNIDMHSHNGALLVNGGPQGGANGQVGAAQGLGVAAGNGAGSSPSPSPLPPASSSSTAAAPASTLPGGPVHKPTFLETKDRRFLIMDAPNDSNLHTYFDVLKKRQVVCVTRVCEPCYAIQPLNQQGIQVFDIPFPDGNAPPPHVVEKWLTLVDQVFIKQGGKDQTGKTNLDLDLSKVAKPAIAIHCVAGLGRAPVMVAIALVESGMEPFDAIAFIRKKRRGAINARQLKYIENYKRRGGQGCCTIQ